MPGTAGTKRELMKILDERTYYWETIRVRHGKWLGTARTNLRGRPIRASATSETKLLRNLVERLNR